MQRLFVYGTLAPGRANHKILQDILGSWEPATTRGTLLEKGWGAALGYPAMIPSASGDEIQGYLFSSEDLAENWPMLDDFEGEGYERVTVTVSVEGNNNVEAYVYALKRDTE
ncbi:MAG: gamma-glutamylcyclotransferase family protein [Gammaproteobacteria bacterium]|nr:gamma-glutamylcyclotransferase family protein [Gammaproteobacteria bacterium]